MKPLLLLVLAPITVFTQHTVNYGNTLVKWERRELSCKKSHDGKSPGACVLLRRNDTVGVPANCVPDIRKGNRYACDIDCDGADRDSVISKTPHYNHKCVRFYSYNSEIDDASGKWHMWRSDQCLYEEISLEVHCGFP